MEKLVIRAVIQAMAQGVYYGREKLVHQCIFPLVKASCFFQYPDWESVAKGWAGQEDSVHCNSDAKEIDPTSPKMLSGELSDHALTINLTECCNTDCNGQDIYDVEEHRTQQLINTLLINRELDAVSKVTGAAWANSSVNPDLESSEGKRYTVSPTDFTDDNFKLAEFFDGIQTDNVLTGKRNFAVIPDALLKKLLRRKDFIGSGCQMPTQTTMDALARELGVERICVPDAVHNTANFGAALNLGHIWPQDTILMGVNVFIPKTNENVRTFGFSANSVTDLDQAEASAASWEVNKWMEPRKGKGSGNEMLKVGHDETAIVSELRAGTLVQVTV